MPGSLYLSATFSRVVSTIIGVCELLRGDLEAVLGFGYLGRRSTRAAQASEGPFDVLVLRHEKPDLEPYSYADNDATQQLPAELTIYPEGGI